MIKEIVVLATILLAVCLPAAAQHPVGAYDKQTAADDGRRIADMANNVNRPRKDIVLFAHLTLKSGDAISDRRKVIIKERRDGDLSRVMFRFVDSMKRGLTFLTIETLGPDNDQYLYAPGIGRPRQIASRDRQNNFEDTDLTYEDLGGLKLDDYTYQRGNDTTIDGRPCFRVTATAEATGARFPRRVSWIDRQTLVPLQVKVYNTDNKLARVIVTADVRAIGGIHIPFKTVAKDLLQDHTTIVDVIRADVDSGIDEPAFDKERMGDPWQETF
jgi:hypothetical protein